MRLPGPGDSCTPRGYAAELSIPEVLSGKLIVLPLWLAGQTFCIVYRCFRHHRLRWFHATIGVLRSFYRPVRWT